MWFVKQEVPVQVSFPLLTMPSSIVYFTTVILCLSTVATQDCPPLESEELEIKCWKSSRTVPCDQPVPSGTRANFRCSPNYTYKNSRPLYTVITCQRGSWSQPLPKEICKPVCGRPNSQGGSSSKISPFPWHVGIYKYDTDDEEWQYSCGGSIVSNKVIVTAAHCIATFDVDFKLEEQKPELYKIGVGKYLSTMNATEDSHGELIEVAKFCTPSTYVGDLRNQADDIGFIILKKALTYNAYVSPVCLDVDVRSLSRFNLSAGTVGKMAGWYNDYAPIKDKELKILDLPYVPPKMCDNTDDLTFRTRMTHDKMCVGDRNSVTAVCSGHAGSGLVFYSRHEKAFYLHGVASSGPRDCRGRSYFLFTRISAYVCNGGWNSFCSV